MSRSLLQLLALVPLPIVALAVYQRGRDPIVEQLPVSKHQTAGGGGQQRTGGIQLPATLEKGWQLKGKIESYDKKSLFDRIDGAAPAYIHAGFTGSLGAEYQQPGLQEPIIIDVYDMGSASQALGMYATERDLSYNFIEVGDGGYLASSSLNFWSGRCYVKLAGYEEGEVMDKALTGLAQGLAKVLPKTAPKEQKALAVLDLLPAADRLPHSEGFSLPPLGDVEGLDHAYYADYKAGEVAFRIFLLREANAGAAAARLEKARAYFQKDGGAVEEKSQDTIKIVTISAGGTGHLLLQQQDVLAGALDLTAAQAVTLVEKKLLDHFTQAARP